jgi:transmembrane sensor
MLHLQSDHMTGSGEVEALTLADGSTVQLGPESAIAVDYEKGARTVRLLAGQAWFDVKRDPGAPFRVAAGELRTTVLGTSFDVRRTGNSIAVSVGHGRVRVVDHGAAARSARDLSAGDWVRVDAGHQMTSGTDNPAILGAWREGTLVVRNRPIAEVIDELRPWYAGRIILLNPALGDKRIDGVFDAANPAGVLTAIARQEGGTLRQLTPWLLIIS